MKKLLNILAVALIGVLATSMSGCTDPVDQTDPVSTVKIAVQSGEIVAGEAGEATFAVETTEILPGSEGTIIWYTDAEKTTLGTEPEGITSSASPVAENKSTVTMTADTDTVAGKYYFTVSFDEVTSDVATLTVKDEVVVYYTVTVQATEGGQATANAPEGTPGTSVEALEDDVITLSANEDEDYKFVKWNVVGESTIEFLPNAETASATFVMPAGDVTVEAEFKEIVIPGGEFGIEVVMIGAGTFMMGSPADEPNRQNGAENPLMDNEIQHEVTLTKDFYMSKYEITTTQYAAFLNDMEVEGTVQGVNTVAICTWGDYEGQILTHDSRKDQIIGSHKGLMWEDGQWSPMEGCEDYPAGWITWYGAAVYAEYVGGSLPTEAQWEYAARGGLEAKPFGLGDGTKLTGDMAKFYAMFPYDVAEGGEYPDWEAELLDEPIEVGSFEANAYGLFDMHGNVWEWVNDWYGQYYGGEEEVIAETDPVGPATSEWNYKVLRGGSFYDNAQFCRSAYREPWTISVAHSYYGFRVVFNE